MDFLCNFVDKRLCWLQILSYSHHSINPEPCYLASMTINLFECVCMFICVASYLFEHLNSYQTIQIKDKSQKKEINPMYLLNSVTWISHKMLILSTFHGQ